MTDQMDEFSVWWYGDHSEELQSINSAWHGWYAKESTHAAEVEKLREELTKREAAAKQVGRDEVMKELSEMNPVWYMYRDAFGYWRNFNEAEAGQMVKRGDSWAAFDKMIRRPTYKKG
jgi:hypothetical protein